jgi:hypothetical protein
MPHELLHSDLPNAPEVAPGMSLDDSVKPRAKLPAGWVVPAKKAQDGHDDVRCHIAAILLRDAEGAEPSMDEPQMVPPDRLDRRSSRRIRRVVG